MKRTSLLLCLLLLSGFAKAQIVNAKPLKGAWREVSRSRSGKTISYRDTLFFEIVTSNLCIWGKSTPEAPRLRLKLIGTTLTIGPYEYNIEEQRDGWMRLSADEGLEIEVEKYENTIVRKPPVTQRKPGVKAVANTNNLKFKPAQAVKMGTVPPSIEPFVGIWKCYKRTSVKPLQNDQKYRLLRLVEIVESGDVITGKLYGFDDLESVPSWVVQKYENGILYSSGKDDRTFKVINCQANELIIENEGVVYYMNKVQQ